MNVKRLVLLVASIAFSVAAAARADNGRSAYTYIRESTGQVTVDSSLNGEVEARRNMPLAAGDQMHTEDPARAEVALADGNVLHVGGGTRIRFDSLSGQQGSDDEVSEITLSEGSVILSVLGSDDHSIPRIDTDDAAVYAGSGSRVRINADPRHGTSVVVRAGSVEVRSRSGSYTVRAGNYLTVQGDQEPEIARGSFSRDRFDLWAADRLEATVETPNASSRYLGDDQYSGDVQSLDGYGNWDYNSDYSTYVWRPNVAAGWSPYSNGSWYYTPAGLTWWSWDPWGWYPFHYGNWFWDVGWNSWCWSPGFIYSPAWCYWGFSGGFFGWSPVGWYGFYSPWYSNYYRNWGWGRGGGMTFALNGRFSTRNVDFRGWNFTNTNNLGGRGRLDVVPGTRMVDRLGSDFSVSSRPIVLANRGNGNVRDALREQIREAPRTIERTAGRDSANLAPVLARQATLPRGTVDALRERTVIADRRGLSGPGAADIAPRGATIVDRGRGTLGADASAGATDRSGGRSVIERSPSNDLAENRGDARPAPGRPDAGSGANLSGQDWRSRGSRPMPDRPPMESRTLDRGTQTDRSAPSDSWRGRPRDITRDSVDNPGRRQPTDNRGQDWRSRSQVPPARRVIEGAVPGRRGQADQTFERSPRRRDDQPPFRGDYRDRQRGLDDAAPPGSYGRSAPRDYAAPRSAPSRSFDGGSRSAPAPHSAPAPNAAPAPRSAPAPAPSHGGSPHSSGRPGRP